jgi:methyl-accepting chemotaxis protein
MVLSSLSIRARLLITSILAISFLALLTGVNLYGQRDTTRSLVQIRDKALFPMLAVQDIEGILKDIRYDMTGTVLDLTSFLGARQRLKEKRENLNPAWQRFRQGFEVSSPEEQQLVQEVGQQLEAVGAFLDALDEAYAKEDHKVVTKLLQQRWPLVQKRLVRPLSELVPARVEAVKATLEVSNSAGRHLNNLSIASFVFCTLGLLVMVLPLTASLNRAIANLKATLAKVAEGDLSVRPDIRRRDELGEMARSLDTTLGHLREILGALKPTGDSLESCSALMSKTLTDVIQQGEQSTSYVNQAALSVERVSQTAEEIAEGASTATGAAEKARDRATNGNMLMENSIKATQRIEAAVTESAAIINELSATTERISEITNAIRGIADQTNLLALNAAIEAARAGEQGRGFAVVADEVRNLAGRTSASTADISGMVETIRSRTSKAVEAMNHVRDEVSQGMRHTSETRAAFEGIVSASSQVTQMAQQIAQATSAQLTAVNGSTQNMDQVIGISQQSRSSLGQVEDISERLTGMSHQLQQIIGRFRIA